MELPKLLSFLVALICFFMTIYGASQGPKRGMNKVVVAILIGGAVLVFGP